MRNNLLAATALSTTVLFLVPGAQAQDNFDWSGFYVGGSAGVVVSNSQVDLTFTDSGNAGLPTSQALSGAGLIGTVSAGYNLQNAGIVYGVQVDGSFLSLTSTGTYASGSASYDINDRVSSLLSARGRLGIAQGNALYYATAGLAAGKVDFGATIIDGRSVSTSPASAGGVVFGPTAGLGFEYALNDNMSVTTEGLVTSLGPLTATGDPGKGTFTATHRSNTVAIRSGLNVHF